MPTAADYPAKGKILRTTDTGVVFAPAGTTYELHLKTSTPYTGPIGKPVEGLIRFAGRKLYTIPSGGNFISPIQGTPKTVQGRVKFLTDKQIVVQAGTTVVIDLPGADNALDLESGQIAAGTLINCINFAGASFELLGTPATV